MHVTDQFGAAADLTQAQYAQVMAEYNAFQHRVKTSIIQVHSERASLPGGGQVEMRHSFGVNTVRVIAPKAMAPAIKGKTIIVDADFIVITYGFTEADGIDLDTRTKLVAPFASNTVGWARDKYIYDIGYLPEGEGEGEGEYQSNGVVPLATWGNDNTGYGFESVFLNLQEIKKIYGNSIISFECRAFWYGRRFSGNCSLYVRAYKGGVMSKSDYSFINDGGAMVAEISKFTNVATNKSENIDGDMVAFIHFDPATNRLTLA